MIVSNVSKLIGNTPMLRIDNDRSGVTIYAKLERFNPGGSVKDRLALSILDRAEREGILKPGDTVVECTSGNVGIAFAMLCAQRGYRFLAVMGDTYTKERRLLLKAYGAKLILFPGDWGSEGGNRLADRLAEENGWFRPMQFSNPANPWYHQQTTVSEILSDLGTASIDAFVAGVGTGGTISGVASILKQSRPDCVVYAVEPEAAPVLRGGEWQIHEIQGLSPNFVPDNYWSQYVDHVIGVGNEEARDGALELASRFGILSGISCGAAFQACKALSDRLPSGSNVVTVLPDTGERYLSGYLLEGVGTNSDYGSYEGLTEDEYYEALRRRIL